MPLPMRQAPDRAVLLHAGALSGYVYHYTTTEGMLGILGSGRLRATDLRYLNDTSELRYGLTELLGLYETTSQAPSRKTSFSDQLAELYDVRDWKPIGPLELSDFINPPRDRFDMLAEAIVNNLNDSILIGVACFCGESDLLSQWRGYGLGGYALGFDARKLHAAVKDLYLPLTPVAYGKPARRPERGGRLHIPIPFRG